MLTVLMATRNGSRTLTSVLECFTHLQTPTAGWKLVVVDNGSTDRTRDIVQSFQTVLPLTYLFEESPGKNAALNTGLAHVDGDLVVFTDDDVFPRPNWLIQLRKGADSHQPYSMFGGAILPRWEVPPEPWAAWVPAAPAFTLTDPRLREGPIDAGLIYGPNMAVRAEVFKAGTCFDPSIGPRGDDYPMGSESELLQRLMRQGHKAWHVQEAVVEHFIREYQMKKPWILKRAIRFGRGQFRLLRSSNPEAVSHWIGVRPRFFLRMIRRLMRITEAWLRSDDQRMLVARWELNCLWGNVVEARRSRRQLYVQRDCFPGNTRETQ